MQFFSCHASLFYSIWLCREHRTGLTAPWEGRAIPVLSQEGSTCGAARASSLLQHQTRRAGEAEAPQMSQAALHVSAGKGTGPQGAAPMDPGAPKAPFTLRQGKPRHLGSLPSGE